MLLKYSLELAARGGVVGGTVIMTKYMGLWGTSQDSDYILKQVKAQTTKSCQLAKIDLSSILDLKLSKRYDEMISNLVVTANDWTFDKMFPTISKLLHCVKIKVPDRVNFIKELQYPDEHVKEERDENEQLKITADLAQDVQKALPQQKKELCAVITVVANKQNDDDENDGKDDVGPILGALAYTLKIITTKSSSSEIPKEFNF